LFRPAIDETGVTPMHVTPDKAKCSPSALSVVLPTVAQRTSIYVNNSIWA
jgi:hypothetical protein